MMYRPMASLILFVRLILLTECGPFFDESNANRIIGGEETSITNYPYQLALLGGQRHICGASVLTNNWALTAAHCVYDQPLRWLTIRAGSSERGAGGTVHPVKYYIYHEKYDKETLDYDVAVVRVKTPFIFSNSVQPVRLPTSVPRGGEVAIASGWGYLQNELLKKPKLLTAVAMQITSWDKCRKIYPSLTERMLCAGDKTRDICSGDSGGPLVGELQEQVGIVSWSYACGDGNPSIFTNISDVSPWIMSTVGMIEEDGPIVFPSK